MPTETKSRKGIGGPKTAEGKAKSKLNSLKDGLHAKSREAVQVVGEAVGVSFDEIHRQMRDYYRPRDVAEETLVRRIARCTWRLAVIETMEDHLLGRIRLGGSPCKRQADLYILDRRTDVQLHRAMAALAAKRKQDRENRKNELNDLPPPGKWPRPEPEPEEGDPQQSPCSGRPEPADSQAKTKPQLLTSRAPLAHNLSVVNRAEVKSFERREAASIQSQGPGGREYPYHP